jgi:hypothetical protein
MKHILPAAAMVLTDNLCTVFPRSARKNRTPVEIKYHSAEGKTPNAYISS